MRCCSGQRIVFMITTTYTETALSIGGIMRYFTNNVLNIHPRSDKQTRQVLLESPLAVHWLTASCKFPCTSFNNFSKVDFFMLHLCLYNRLTEGTRKQLWVFTRANNLSQESYWSRHVRLRCFTYSYCLLYTSILTHIFIIRYSVTPRCDCDRCALYI